MRLSVEENSLAYLTSSMSAVDRYPWICSQTALSSTDVKLRCMKKRAMSLCATVLLLLWFVPALGQQSADLYAAEVAVADEGSEARNAALSEMLADILVRVSGNAGIAGMPAAHDLLASAPSLVQQYRYRTVEGEADVSRYLWARFDQAAIERMMRERGLPVWVQRPRVLMWVATERGGRRSLLNLENEPQARAAALARAQQRGMPLQLPLMDLEDQAALTAADLWSGYLSGIRLASARYPHQVILAGRLSARRGGQWQSNWALIDGDDSQEFQAPVLGLGEALAFGLDQTQNLLAAHYAPMPGAGGRSGTLVEFADVHDLAAYGSLVALLGSLEAVSQVALRYVDGDQFIFEVQLRGDQQELSRALESSGRLIRQPGPGLRMPVESPTAAAGTPDTATSAAPPEADLYYRLLN